MVIKLYISGISGNKEVKKKQQRVQMILDSKQISYEAIDITEPGKEKDKEFMQQNGKVRESLGKHPLPPQIFNDDDFCGDYEDFDMANEVDELEKFLHIETSSKDIENGSKHNGGNGGLCEDFSSCKSSKTSTYDPYDYHTFKIKWDSVNGLQEQIIENIRAGGENEQPEEITKSEVNGESEAVPPSETSENVAENKSETFTEVVEKEEVENEKETVEENSEVKNEENEKDNQMQNEADLERVEEKEKEEEISEDFGIKKGDETEVEKPLEEESFNPEKENVEEVDNEPEEHNDSENEDENDNKTLQSEKSEED